jgi:hypothetical protein
MRHATTFLLLALAAKSGVRAQHSVNHGAPSGPQ